MDKGENWDELIHDLNGSYELDLAERLTSAELEAQLAAKLNVLIRDNFNALLQLLYRIDINEARLRRLLTEEPGEDAGRIIARLIIERQRQKIETRRQFKATDGGSEEEKW
jgi:hypothetical protein